VKKKSFLQKNVSSLQSSDAGFFAAAAEPIHKRNHTRCNISSFQQGLTLDLTFKPTKVYQENKKRPSLSPISHDVETLRQEEMKHAERARTPVHPLSSRSWDLRNPILGIVKKKEGE